MSIDIVRGSLSMLFSNSLLFTTSAMQIRALLSDLSEYYIYANHISEFLLRSHTKQVSSRMTQKKIKGMLSRD